MVMGHVEATASVPSQMYILGEVNQYTDVPWVPTQGVQMTSTGIGTFTATVYCQKEWSYFSFAEELNNWDALNANGSAKRYGSGASGDYWEISHESPDSKHFDREVELYRGSQKSYRVPAGVYTITLSVADNGEGHITVSKKATTVTTLPAKENVKVGTVITAKSNLTNLVAATGSGETVTVQVKTAGTGFQNSVTLNESGLATVYAKASIGDLVVENTMSYNVRAISAMDLKTYEWTDSDGEVYTSALTDPATNPYQIMALLNAIYTDPTIPGAKTHLEYKPDGTPWADDPTYTQTSETEVDYEAHSRTRYTWNGSTKRRTNMGPRVSWINCDGDVPSPNEEGATVLFIQIKDSWKAEDIQDYYMGGKFNNATPATKDFNIINDAYESVQLITNTMRIDDSNNPGNLMLIDNVTTSRFYFISKGRVRSGDGRAPLWLAYEQLSPVQLDPREDMGEVLNAGGVYNFVHDCYDIFRGDKATSGDFAGQYVPHYAQISGFNAGDLNELEAKAFSNLTLFLPDKRFKCPDSSSSRPQGFLYNYDGEEDVTTAPKLLLYQAELEATATPSSHEGYYDIQLDWNSWFDKSKIKADVDEQFYVYVFDDDGNKMLLNELIASNNNYQCDTALLNPTMSKSYTYRVKKLQERQTFTFIVIANPMGSEMFVKTNVAKVVIPGNDNFFLNGEEYRSRYDLTNESNVYKNTLRFSPNGDYENINCTADHYEIYRTPQGGTKTKIATISFTKSGSSYNYIVNYVAGTQNTTLTFDDVVPATSGTLTSDGYLDIIDRFTESTATNSHPEAYVYYLGTTDSNASSSNIYTVPVMKTDNHVQLAGFTLDEINGDTNRTLGEDKEVQITFHAKMDQQMSIDRYDVHRVHSADYHTHIGKAKHTIGGSMAVIGINHETGHMVNDLGTINILEEQLLTVYDDIEYCPTSYPEYLTEIYTNILDLNNNFVTNSYGTEIVKTEVPELEVTLVRKIRTEPFYGGKSGDDMVYLAELQLTPTLHNAATEVYFYRVWRIDEDGSEVLLNSVETPFGDSNYDELTSPYAREASHVTDVFMTKAIPVEKTETVTVIDYDEDGAEVGSHEEQVTTGGTYTPSYIVRMYSTRSGISHAPGRGKHRTPSAEGAYYVTEKAISVPYDYTNNTPTAIENVDSKPAEVVSVVFYNLQGVKSDRPFDGFNIIVTTLSDGTQVTAKQWR